MQLHRSELGVCESDGQHWLPDFNSSGCRCCTKQLILVSHLVCGHRLYGEMELLSTAVPQQTVVGDAVPETQHVLSKEDFLKLMLPDSPLVEEGRRKVSTLGGAFMFRETLRKSLKRHQPHPHPRVLPWVVFLMILPIAVCPVSCFHSYSTRKAE